MRFFIIFICVAIYLIGWIACSNHMIVHGRNKPNVGPVTWVLAGVTMGAFWPFFVVVSTVIKASDHLDELGNTSDKHS